MDSVEAGIALTGTEIKSIRLGRISLGDAYVKPEGGELWLVNTHIARYEPGGYMSHEPMRDRKLLLHRKQIEEFTRKVAEKGFTLVPLKVYIDNKGLAKVDIGLARGKKLYDKREAIARRDTAREIEQTIKKQRLSRR